MNYIRKYVGSFLSFQGLLRLQAHPQRVIRVTSVRAHTYAQSQAINILTSSFILVTVLLCLVCSLTSSKVIMFGAFGFNSCPLSPVFWVPLLYAKQPKQGISYEVRYSSINQAYHKTSHMSIKLKCLFLGCLTDSVSLTLHHSCIFLCDLSCDCAAFERLKGKVNSDYFIIFIVFTVSLFVPHLPKTQEEKQEVPQIFYLDPIATALSPNYFYCQKLLRKCLMNTDFSKNPSDALPVLMNNIFIESAVIHNKYI